MAKEPRYGSQSARAKRYADGAVVGGSLAALGGAAFGAGKAVQRGGANVRETSILRLKGLNEEAKRIHDDPTTPRRQNGQPSLNRKTPTGRRLVDIIDQQAVSAGRRDAAPRTIATGRKIARGGKIAAGVGGLAALASGLMAERARHQARNPKAPKKGPAAPELERARLRPAGRPAGAREFEEDPETGKLRVKRTPRQEAYDEWIKEGPAAYADDPKYAGPRVYEGRER